MPEVHPDELAFLARIAETPDHALPRLVFADWLDERNDPRAAWVRDDDLWEWMKPDARDPIPRILSALTLSDFKLRASGRCDGALASKAASAFAKLEPMAVEAIRDWLRARPDHYPSHEVQAFVAVHPPAELRSVEELCAALNEKSWVQLWLTVVDLGFHGPAAAPAVTELMQLHGWDKCDEMHVAFESVDLPVENAIYRTLGRIGLAAARAVPWLAAIAWIYPESICEALVRLRVDPDLVVQHINDDADWDTVEGLRIATRLTDDPVSLLVRTAHEYEGRKAYGAISCLGEMGPKAAAAIPALTQLSHTRTGWDADIVRGAATRALAQICPEAEPPRSEANGT